MTLHSHFTLCAFPMRLPWLSLPSYDLFCFQSASLRVEALVSSETLSCTMLFGCLISQPDPAGSTSTRCCWSARTVRVGWILQCPELRIFVTPSLLFVPVRWWSLTIAQECCGVSGAVCVWNATLPSLQASVKQQVAVVVADILNSWRPQNPYADSGHMCVAGIW